MVTREIIFDDPPARRLGSFVLSMIMYNISFSYFIDEDVNLVTNVIPQTPWELN